MTYDLKCHLLILFSVKHYSIKTPFHLLLIDGHLRFLEFLDSKLEDIQNLLRHLG